MYMLLRILQAHDEVKPNFNCGEALNPVDSREIKPLDAKQVRGITRHGRDLVSTCCEPTFSRGTFYSQKEFIVAIIVIPAVNVTIKWKD